MDLFLKSTDQIHADFPLLNEIIHGYPLAYLDNAATSQKPESVIEAIANYYRHDNANVHRSLHELSHRATMAYEDARKRVAQYIGAASQDEIVFTRGTTESVNLLANAWGRENLKPGDVILLTEMEHHSNLVPWQMISKQTGAVIKYVPISGMDGLLNLEAARSLLATEPKIFAFTHISNTLGTVNPVTELCSLARKFGVLSFVDAAQSAGHCPVSVQELGCDFLAFSGHKMCGPTGIGIFFGRSNLLEQFSPWQGGGEMIANVQWEKSEWKMPPYRFEAGTPPIAGAIGLRSAMDYLEKLGREKIAAYDAYLVQYALACLKEIPELKIIGPHQNRAALVSFFIDGIHAHDLVTYADQYGIALRGGHHCNQPLMRKLGLSAVARASFYLYNTTQEVDRLMDVLRKAILYFK